MTRSAAPIEMPSRSGPPPARSSAKDVARLAGVSTATVSRFLNSPEQVDVETRALRDPAQPRSIVAAHLGPGGPALRGALVHPGLVGHLARAIRNHGWARDLPADSTLGTRQDDPFFEAYRFVLPGYNVRPLEMAGAVGVEQLKKLDAMIAIRRANAALFVKLFKDDPRFIIQREHGVSSGGNGRREVCRLPCSASISVIARKIASAHMRCVPCGSDKSPAT